MSSAHVMVSKNDVFVIFPTSSKGSRRAASAQSQLGDAAFFVRSLPFAWPEKKLLPTVFPVFLPFRGCQERCIFCAQDAQTGRASNHDACQVLEDVWRTLQQRAAQGCEPVELAFYGGTFTALPPTEWERCLALVVEARKQGLITSFRCSTRPDRVNGTRLAALRAAGGTLVELGVQSFADAALTASCRGYTGAVARDACAAVRKAGLQLGVQLLPGMPGHTPAMFLEDVTTALAAGAQRLRFYPCLVLAGTKLAALWRSGQYTPWTLAETLDTLAAGWLAATQANVPVIRMGLCPEPQLQAVILAGPMSPALGSRVMGHALLRAVRHILHTEAGENTKTTFDLLLPQAAQGCLWGHKGELRAVWKALGLRTVRYAGR